MLLSLEELARACSGAVMRPGAGLARRARTVCWDSRLIEPGAVFFALAGARTDGHDHVEAAFRAGACAAVVARDPGEAADRAAVQTGGALIRVDDTERALTALARAWRARLDALVVGITGSVGKTTTKNLTRAVLETMFPTVATRANQNNELGVPATILAADADARVVVVEMGMRGLGQIAQLCDIVRPSWGLITNVGTSHIELLGTRENIARAKAELFSALPAKTGRAFVNRACDFSRAAVGFGGLARRGVPIVCFDGAPGAAERAVQADDSFSGCDAVWAEDVALDARGRASFALHARGFDAPSECVGASLALAGAHSVEDAVAAAAVGRAAGIPLERCARALGAAAPERGRQNVIEREDGALVIDDAYNANPASMAAALHALGALAVPGARIAVLGDMGELGDVAAQAHEEAGALCARVGTDRLVAAGAWASVMARGACEAGLDARRIVCVEDAAAALDAVRGMVGPGDAVLVKASHFMGFEHIVEGLVG